jgi:hypothetical protein
MTTQLPYGPPQQPQWGQQQPSQYGGLMVPYPELIRTAGAPKPSWVPVVAWTFFFSLLGLISAARRAGKARRAGHPGQPYWIAFGVTWVASFVIWAVAMAIAIPVYLNIRHEAVAKSIAENLTAQPAAKGVRISSADCEPLNRKGPGGLDAYSCHVTLSTGADGAVTVLADGDGTVKGERQN